MSRSPRVPNLVTLAQMVSELEGKRPKVRPAGALLHPRGGSTPWHSSQTKALLAGKFGLPASPRLGCRRVRIFFELFTWRHVAGHT